MTKRPVQKQLEQQNNKTLQTFRNFEPTKLKNLTVHKSVEIVNDIYYIRIHRIRHEHGY